MTENNIMNTEHTSVEARNQDAEQVLATIVANLNGEVIDTEPETTATSAFSVDKATVTDSILEILDEGASKDDQDAYEFDQLATYCELLGMSDIRAKLDQLDSDKYLPFAAGVQYFYYEDNSRFKGNIVDSINESLDKAIEGSYKFYPDVTCAEELGHAYYDEMTGGHGLPYQYSVLEDCIDYVTLGDIVFNDHESSEGTPSYDYYGFYAPYCCY